MPGHRPHDPFSLGSAAIGTGHGRGRAALIDEHQALRIQPGHCFREVEPLLLDFRLLLFAGVEHLLLAGDAELAQGAPDCHAAARHADLLTQLVQGAVGLTAEDLSQAFAGLAVEGRRLSAAVGAWLKGAGLSLQAQQANKEGEADTKAEGELPQGSLLVFDGVRDAFTEVLRIRFHTASLDWTSGKMLYFSLLFPFYAVGRASVNRSSWCIYQHVARGQNMLQVGKTLTEVFQLPLG